MSGTINSSKKTVVGVTSLFVWLFLVMIWRRNLVPRKTYRLLIIPKESVHLSVCVVKTPYYHQFRVPMGRGCPIPEVLEVTVHHWMSYT